MPYHIFLNQLEMIRKHKLFTPFTTADAVGDDCTEKLFSLPTLLVVLVGSLVTTCLFRLPRLRLLCSTCSWLRLFGDLVVTFRTIHRCILLALFAPFGPIGSTFCSARGGLLLFFTRW